ncbi:MAG: transporter substrate-binding domain-containing protein [Clostridia bacterium]|nr:transporter substrate-binding domain-containing protein [Clostridia bacterium]MBR5265007.1 transporter substrate-binding domain-containing protein [Clostridia bacterium]
MNKTLKRALSLMFVVVMMASMFAGCSAKEETTTAATAATEATTAATEATTAAEPKDPIIVACGGDWLPYAFMEDDKLQGFDIDVWTEIGVRTGREIKFEIIDMNGMFGMIDADKADFAARQITVTEARKEKYDFTDIYAYSPYRITVRNEVEDVTCMDDLIGKKMIYNPTSSSGQYLDSYDPDQTKIERITLDGGSAWEELHLGRVDATFTNYNIFEMQRAKGDYEVKQVGDPVFCEENAYPCLKNSGREELLEEVNAVLKEMRADGTLSELSIKWVGADVTDKDNIKIED